ncbi:MarR family winged helix-turn-helix transcriptional regulator, partial [Streptomyces sp. NPDC059742]|uniref:MarR family winged helix-turn-helix transcriptional regulator n=1 Tax=Streptomyces sp. NPDC059742 TaxID=3346927 RepID=UPI00366A13CB
MTATDSALTALSQGWCALSLLHGRIEAHIERALQAGHGLSVREYSLLDVLSRQHNGPGGHLRMHQVADSVVLSQSATTRLVSRLEDRGLLNRYICDTDRRGIYTDVSEAGLTLLAAARPTNDTALGGGPGARPPPPPHSAHPPAGGGKRTRSGRGAPRP